MTFLEIALELALDLIPWVVAVGFGIWLMVRAFGG